MRTQGRVDATPPPTAGGLFTLRETFLCSVGRGLSLLFSALFNDRPASLFLINTPSQPPNPTAKITTSFTDKNMSLNIYWSFSVSYITQADKDPISWAVSVKNNYLICSRSNYGSLYSQYSSCMLQSWTTIFRQFISRKFVLEQVTKAQCGSKSIAPLFQTRRQMGKRV